MKGGLLYSDVITTVSPTYAEEIQTPYFGENLDSLLRSQSDRLHGIVNGIDYEEFDPMKDPRLFFINYRDSLVKKEDEQSAAARAVRAPGGQGHPDDRPRNQAGGAERARFDCRCAGGAHAADANG